MEKSYTQGRNLFGQIWTKNNSTANLAFGDQMANDAYDHIMAMRDWPFLERFRTIPTQANVKAYAVPYDTDLIKHISVKVNTLTYPLVEITDRAEWDFINLVPFTSDYTRNFYRTTVNTIELFPITATTGNSIQFTIKAKVQRLARPDYTTGTINSIYTNPAIELTTITGQGTSWDIPMTGRFIQVTAGDAMPSGDDLWYEIAGVQDATHLQLVRAYGGSIFSGGSVSYTIGQMPLLPKTHHDTIWKKAASIYWGKEADTNRSTYFENEYTGDLQSLVDTYSNQTTDMVLDEGEDREIVNPNLTINLTPGQQQ